MLTRAEIRAYFERIAYDGPLTANLDTLRAVQRAHVQTVPFENLDIHLGRPIPLDVPRAFDKIVGARRGGYCYELNALFHALLRALGFDADLLAARVVLRDAGHPFDHATVLVHLEKDRIADVGYGRSPPLIALDETDAVPAGHEPGRFRIERRGDEYVVSGSKGAEGFEALFAFRPVPRDLAEFAERADWTQSAPESVFTRAPLCTMPLAGGRVTISGLNCIRSAGEEAKVRAITPDERDALLGEVFGIDLGGARLADGDAMRWIPGRGMVG